MDTDSNWARPTIFGGDESFSSSKQHFTWTDEEDDFLPPPPEWMLSPTSPGSPAAPPPVVCCRSILSWFLLHWCWSVATSPCPSRSFHRFPPCTHRVFRWCRRLGSRVLGSPPQLTAIPGPPLHTWRICSGAAGAHAVGTSATAVP